MFFILSKIAGYFIQPIIWIAILLILSWIFKSKAWSKYTRLATLVIFVLFSNAFLFEETKRLWITPPTLDADLPNEGMTAVVLGGFSNYDFTLERIQFSQASDRLWQAMRLASQNCIEELIISGGSGRLREPENKESVFVQKYLEEIQFNHCSIRIEANSRNTFENARNTRELIGTDNPIILITSESHMKRAVACFEKQGFRVIPYTCDRSVGPRRFHIEHLLIPNIGILGAWAGLFHEIMGYFSYRVSGYL